jgi:hypothetical protein
MEIRGVMIIYVIGVPLLVCLCNVEGVCSKALFYNVFSGLPWFYAMYGVFGWASLYDTTYRCVMGRSGRFVWTGCVGWNGIGRCGGRWSGAFSAFLLRIRTTTVRTEHRTFPNSHNVRVITKLRLQYKIFVGLP